MIILFQNSLFLKEFLACNCCFGLFSKIKKGSGANFWWTFYAWFFHENVPYLILFQWIKFQCHLISSSRYQTKCVINFLIRQLMTSLSLRFFLGQPPKQWLTGKNRGRQKTKIWIFQDQKELFRWNKNILYSFWRAIIWWKNKHLIKKSRHKL